MQGEPAEWIGTGSVSAVSCYRVADPLGLCPDLVLSACFQGEFDIRVGMTFYFCPPDSSAMAYCKLPSVVAAAALHLQGLWILPEPGFDISFLAFDLSFEYGGVSSLRDHLLPVALQYLLGPYVFSEDEKSGCIPVKAV